MSATPHAALDLLKRINAGKAVHRAADAVAEIARLKAAAGDAQQAGDHPAALVLIEKALSQAPADAELFFLEAVSRYQEQGAAAALAPMRKAAQLTPDHPAVLANLGRILLDLDCDRQAEEALVQALRLAPKETAALRALASLKRNRGETDAADALWLRLLAENPADAEAHYNRAHHPDYRPAAGEIAALERFAASAANAFDRALLSFALFRAHEAHGDATTAFARLTEANRAMALHRPTDGRAEARAIAAMTGHFTAERLSSETSGAKPTGGPIFILGMPRSGTSLAEQILSSHRLVHGGGERPEIADLVGRYLTGADGASLDLSDFSPGSDKARRMAADYLYSLDPVRGDRPFVTDKMPLNFRFIGIIKTLFPTAKIIHCTRAPIETCLSIHANAFAADGIHFATDLEQLGRYYAGYVRLMAHWRSVLGENRIFHLDLDRLKADQEGETRRLIAHCGLDWDPACLAFETNVRSVKTLSAARVHQPLDRSPDRRTALLRPFLAPLEQVLRDAGIDPDRQWSAAAADCG